MMTCTNGPAVNHYWACPYCGGVIAHYRGCAVLMEQQR